MAMMAGNTTARLAAREAIGISNAFLVDGFIYALLAGGSLVQLVRNCFRYRPWTVQKMIHLLLFIGTFVRAFFLVLVGLDWCGLLSGEISIAKCTPTEREIFYIIDQVPMVMFFAVYALLVQFWAEVYYNAVDKLVILTSVVKPALRVFIAVVLAAQILFWGLYASAWKSEKSFFSKSQAILNMLSFIAVTVCFIYFARLAYTELRSVPVELRIRSRKLRELALMTTVCSSCFIARCLLQLVLSTESKQLHDSSTWFLLFIYYAFLEIVPAISILYFNRRLPLRRRKDGTGSAASTPIAAARSFFGRSSTPDALSPGGSDSLRKSLLHNSK
ncbi:TPA: hypothetical protein N0F65_005893 [Lagenidium giganteum]|uniref:THH1/TOM1/TOM3 domain-containing protein n=1 Tax=Lagenidium giganteum TaxID=4803 RepID=A0AAV2Z993_9STRA|nr:TPA: hypothetical protein N0F65_005893 [Lagenidium giganteum]